MTIKVVTKLLDSQQVVESESFDSLDIILGESDVFQGLDLVIPLMDQKEVAQVHISPRFAYGEKGKKVEGTEDYEVPPNAKLDCEVHVLSCEWIDEENPLPIDDRIRLGTAKKERGNFWIKRGDYSTSITCYKNAIKLLDATEEELSEEDKAKIQGSKEESQSSADKNPEMDEKKVKELIDLRSTTYNNLALAQMKIDDLNGALKSVEAALLTHPNNVKALFRLAKIWAVKKEYLEAIKVLKKAQTLEPENKAVAQDMAIYLRKYDQQLKAERKMAAVMIGEKEKPTKGSSISSKVKNSWGKWSVIGGSVTATLALATAIAYKAYQ